jgi:hypothetical protein
MPSLTRRRSDNPHQVTWHVYYDDVHVGTIGERAGVPVDVDRWKWSCGFYPRLHSGQHKDGTAATFEEARAGFEADWRGTQSVASGINQRSLARHADRVDAWSHFMDYGLLRGEWVIVLANGIGAILAAVILGCKIRDFR